MGSEPNTRKYNESKHLPPYSMVIWILGFPRTCNPAGVKEFMICGRQIREVSLIRTGVVPERINIQTQVMGS